MTSRLGTGNSRTFFYGVGRKVVKRDCVETWILQLFKGMYNSVLLSGLLFYIEFLKLLPKYLSTADIEQTLLEISDCFEFF